MKDPEIILPSLVYEKSQDKQRVVVTGGQAKMITAIVVFVLKTYDREFDFVLPGANPASHFSDAPLIIIEDNSHPTNFDYHHHIGVISEVNGPIVDIMSRFADATPKGGVLIYSEVGAVGAVGKKERPDITSIPYKAYPHVLDNGSVSLLTSQNEKKAVRLTGDQALRNISAAEEILKKVAITSSQFYQAIASFGA